MPKSTDISSLLQLISTCEIDTQKYVCVMHIVYLLLLGKMNKKKKIASMFLFIISICSPWTLFLHIFGKT